MQDLLYLRCIGESDRNYFVCHYGFSYTSGSSLHEEKNGCYILLFSIPTATATLFHLRGSLQPKMDWIQG